MIFGCAYATVIYEESIDTKMNGLGHCLEVVSVVVSRSCQPLRHIRRWISRKPLEIEVWFQRTTNRKWPTGNQIVTWPMTSSYPERSNSCWRPDTLRAQYLENSWNKSVNLACKTVFTARCTLVQSAVLRSHVVCLSVRPSVCLWRWWIVIT